MSMTSTRNPVYDSLQGIIVEHPGVTDEIYENGGDPAVNILTHGDLYILEIGGIRGNTFKPVYSTHIKVSPLGMGPEKIAEDELRDLEGLRGIPILVGGHMLKNHGGEE